MPCYHPAEMDDMAEFTSKPWREREKIWTYMGHVLILVKLQIYYFQGQCESQVSLVRSNLTMFSSLEPCRWRSVGDHDERTRYCTTHTMLATSMPAENGESYK